MIVVHRGRKKTECFHPGGEGNPQPPGVGGWGGRIVGGGGAFSWLGFLISEIVKGSLLSVEEPLA